MSIPDDADAILRHICGGTVGQRYDVSLFTGVPGMSADRINLAVDHLVQSGRARETAPATKGGPFMFGQIEATTAGRVEVEGLAGRAAPIGFRR